MRPRSHSDARAVLRTLKTMIMKAGRAGTVAVAESCPLTAKRSRLPFDLLCVRLALKYI